MKSKLFCAVALAGALAFTAASVMLPLSANAATAFIQLFEINSGHSVCNPLCTSIITSSPIALPTTTFNGATTHITASGSVSANTITSFVSSDVGAEFLLGISDTYTVHGTAAGVFSITTTFGVTGLANTIPSGSANVLFAGNAQVKIGTYALNTQATVIPFEPTSEATTGGITLVSGPSSVPIDIAASHTRTVAVGDVFDIAYLLRLAFAKGEIDLSHTATISFLLPDDVYLTSELGGVFGIVPTTPGDTPLPAALPLFATGLGALGLLGWRRKRKQTA